MKMRNCVLGVLAVLALPFSVIAQTIIVPPSKPPIPVFIVDGLATGAQTTGEVGSMAVDAGKALGGTIDKSAEQFLGNVGKVGDAAGTGVRAYEAFRKEGTEGMMVFGAQEALDRGGEAAGDAAAGAYTAWRAGKVLSATT